MLEHSFRESLQLGHSYIGTEHILLGLIHASGGIAAQVLTQLGGSLPRVRYQVVQLLDDRASSAVTGDQIDVADRLGDILGRLAAIERRLGEGPG